MKDGIYLNLHKGKANLILVDDGQFIDGEEVSIEDYNVAIKLIETAFIMELNFSELEYLGKL